MNKSILILSSGRRVELVNCFKNKGYDIVCVDCSDYAPTLKIADKGIKVLSSEDDGYINQIISICKDNNVKLIVPTIDRDLRKMAVNKDIIEKSTNAKVLVSDVNTINIFDDKKKTNNFFEKNNIHTPNEIKKDCDFPVFIKPSQSSGSNNCFKVNNKKELDFFKEYIDNPIVQEYVIGNEYTVDCLVGYDHKPISIVPRKRIATRSGEVLVGMIEHNDAIIDRVIEIIDKVKFVGPITIQCIETCNDIKFIEINPRFGGGVPMSINAGSGAIDDILKMINGEKIEYHDNYESDVLFERFDESIKEYV